jgi:hypothetical protein
VRRAQDVAGIALDETPQISDLARGALRGHRRGAPRQEFARAAVDPRRRQVVDAGTSVIVIEHHQAVMAHADWIIDPGAGHDGGRIVFEGMPSELVAARSTLTGEHLAASVGA